MISLGYLSIEMEGFFQGLSPFLQVGLAVLCVVGMFVWLKYIAQGSSVGESECKKEPANFSKTCQQEASTPMSVPTFEQDLPHANTTVDGAHSASAEEQSSEGMEQATLSVPDGVWVLHIVPKDRGAFVGYDLLQALASCHVHFTDKGIFARHETIEGAGKIWFYIASCQAPGTFSMSEPGKVRCEGLVLILNTDKVEHLMDAYSAFVTTAKQLARELGGKMLDDKRQVLSERTLNLWHQYIFEQKGLTELA